MKKQKQKVLVTAALPYTNNVPHIGNIVGSHLPADIFVRFNRLLGNDTVFVGGTDEHGSATEIAAQKASITPKQLCDFFYKIHKDIYDWWNISYDNFSRTSKQIHYETTQGFFKLIYKNGFIKEQLLKLPFCLSCNRALPDRFIEGECPYCHKKARGDQCESCSKVLDPIQLINPKCAVCNLNKIEFKEKKHLFLELDKLSIKLSNWLKANKEMRPQVKKLAMGWIKEGLKPRCITRDLKWGVNVPIKGYEDVVFYCWFDAPIGYISSTKEWHKTKWKEFWTKGTKIYNFVGKDNIPFHTIFFPGMVMANEKYSLPYNVVGLQYCNYEKSKISKSASHGIFCENLPSSGLEADYWRFYSTYLIPETKDTDFIWNEFKERVNSELVGNVGNLVNRTTTFIYTKFKGELEKPKLNVRDKAFIKKIDDEIKKTLEIIGKVNLREGLEKILTISALTNKYFQDNEPWKRDDRAGTIMYVCANTCEKIGLLLLPYIPNKAQEILNILNSKAKDFASLKKLNLGAGHKINKPQILFNKLEDEKIEELKQKTSKVTEYFKKKEEQKMAVNKTVELVTSTYMKLEDFRKFNIRIGTIKAVKDHPDADKLYILLIKFNDEPDRQIVAGLKKNYNKEELIGKQVSVIVNLEPAVLRGIESNGMLLAAVSKKDDVRILTVDGQIDNNSKVM